MNKIKSQLLITKFFVVIISSLLIPTIAITQVNRPVGINLAGIEDWSEEFVFVDIMNQSREWIPFDVTPNAPWSSDVEIPLRSDGYPLEIPFSNGVNEPQAVRTLMYFGELDNLYPSGSYQLKIDGSGTVELWGSASGVYNCPVDTTVMVNNNGGGIALEIYESKVNDPIHNIRMIMPGFENTYETNPYHPKLLEFLSDFQMIRYMDWMKTNNSEVTTWSDRTLPQNYTQTARNGVAYEHIIALSNLLSKDVWINIPHQADDDYIRQLAILLRDNLDPELKIYIEYSNEIWNSIFSQNQYATDAAEQIGIPGEPWEQAWTYTAKRSADVFQIFENEFNSEERFIKVIPGFSASPYITNFIVDKFQDTQFNPNQITADAVAIAPYFGGALADDLSDQNLQNTITVNEIIDSLALRLPEAYSYMQQTKEIADNQNLDLIAYEGGQHLVANFPNNENELFVEKLLEANRHAKMQEFYCEYFDYWYDVVEGGIFAHFSSHGGYNQFGSWGIKESYEDTESPKYLALIDCVFELNLTSTANDISADQNNIEIYPNPVINELTIKSDKTNNKITLHNSSGQLIKVIISNETTTKIKFNNLESGIFILKIKNLESNTENYFKILKF